MADTDICIVGAGCSGLAFAATLAKQRPWVQCTVFETGKRLNERSHANQLDIVNGSGGAGLYSDGKFSGHPSATALWEVEGAKDAYTSLQDQLTSFNIQLPQWDVDTPANISDELKRYPSVKGSLTDRLAFIKHLEDIVTSSQNVKLCFNTTVTGIERVDSGDSSSSDLFPNVLYRVIKSDGTSTTCKRVVLAGGRFGPLNISLPTSCETTHKRVEFGARIVLPTQELSPVFKAAKENNLLDPKFKTKLDDNTEILTFCVCKDGYLLWSEDKISGIKSCSGTTCADEQTEQTQQKPNFGLNVRVKTDASQSIINQLTTSNPSKTFSVTLAAFLEDSSILAPFYGDEGAALFATAIKKVLKTWLLHSNVTDLTQIQLEGPQIEGVGRYAKIDNKTLTTSDANIAVIGDCGGSFRGLVGALVSGIATATSDFVNKLVIANCLASYQQAGLLSTIHSKQIEGSLDYQALAAFATKLSHETPNFISSRKTESEQVRIAQEIQEIDAKLPPLMGGITDIGICHELHLFLGWKKAIVPNLTTAVRYAMATHALDKMLKESAAAVYSEEASKDQNWVQNTAQNTLKSCLLSLRFTPTDVPVMQSAKKIYVNGTQQKHHLLSELVFQRDFYRTMGEFDILRTKIETQVYNVDFSGIETDKWYTFDDNKALPKQGDFSHYCECHTKVVFKQTEFADRVNLTAKVADKLCSLGVRKQVPISWNLLKHPDKGEQQMFINYRTLGTKAPSQMIAVTKQLTKAITAEFGEIVEKVFPDCEFVAFDDCKPMDQGWFLWDADY